jgi:trans-2,3-dihydro-3-hydroxyanthranilate isomerase
MKPYRVALFDAFSEELFGGSVAGIICDAQDLPDELMQQIAKEIGAPATCFIVGVDDCGVEVRFFSTVKEYPMCGHGTVALMTWLAGDGVFTVDPGEKRVVELRTPSHTTNVALQQRPDGRLEVMLTLSGVAFESRSVSESDLIPLFGTAIAGAVGSLPSELAVAEFSHLVVPVDSLETMRHLSPDYGKIESLCQTVNADTLALFTLETERPESTIHCREFCPRVGTPEAPASGTTNRALACYLLRYGLIHPSPEGYGTVISEQGYEMGRPSLIRTELQVCDGKPAQIKVGGVATKTIEGVFYVS